MSVRLATPLILFGVALAAALGSCKPATPDTGNENPSAPQSSEPVYELVPLKAEFEVVKAEMEALVNAMPSIPDGSRMLQLVDLIETAFAQQPSRIQRMAARSMESEEGIDFALESVMEGHDDPRVRALAIRALGDRKRHAAIPKLLHQIKYEKDGAASAEICLSLCKLGNHASFRVIDLLIDRADAMQAAGQVALEMLAIVGRPQPEGVGWVPLRAALGEVYAKWLETGLPERFEEGDGVAEAPNVVVEDDPLLHGRLAQRMLNLDLDQLRPADDARMVLRQMGVLGLTVLSRGVVAADPHIRTHTLEAVRDLGRASKPLGPLLLQQLDDQISGELAAIVLGRIGHTEALPHLAARAYSDDLRAQNAAVQGLSWLRDPRGLPVLRDIMNDPEADEGVRVQAAFGVAWFDEGFRYLQDLRTREAFHEPTLNELIDQLRGKR